MIELTFLKELMLIRQAITDICHCWYFLDKGFKFQPHVYNCGPDVLMMSMNLSNIVILNIHGVDYAIISKNEAINLLQSVDLIKKN